MKPADHAEVELDGLVGLFFEQTEELGSFSEITAEQMPETERLLLAHDRHMTVSVEKHHHCKVDVRVLDTKGTGEAYSRKILLTRQSDQCVVQFGIVKLDLTVLAPDVRREIESEQIPLGRVLIEHDVMRQVKLLKLFRIESGGELAAAFGLPLGEKLYGRTAMIWLDGNPAIELLEIVGNC